MKKFSTFLMFALLAWSSESAVYAEDFSLRSVIKAGNLQKLVSETLSESQVSVGEFFGDFFSTTTCLPSKVQKKLNKKLNKNGVAHAIPDDLFQTIKDIKDEKVSKAEDRSLRAMLHVFKFKNNESYEFLRGDTYTTLNPYSLLDGERTNFIYILDCNGYVSNLAKAKVGLSAGEIETSASLAADKKKVYSASRAKMKTIIEAAMSPATAGLTLDNRTSIDVLFPLLATMQESTKDEIIVPSDIDIIATAVSEDSSLQGKIDLKAGGGFSAGIGSVNVTSESGMSMDRQYSFNLPKSAIVSYGKTKSYSKTDIKNTLKIAITNIDIISKTNSSGVFELKTSIGNNICSNGQWTITTTNQKDNTQLGTKPLTAKFKDNNCVLTSDMKNEFAKVGINGYAIFEVKPTAPAFSAYDQKDKPSFLTLFQVN